MVLDEPLNGLDPLARSEAIALFRSGARGRHVIGVESHLHEVDQISDQVILLSQATWLPKPDPGRPQRGEGPAHADPGPLRPARDAGRAPLSAGPRGGSQDPRRWQRPVLRTKDADSFYLLLNRVIPRFRPGGGIRGAADDDVNSVYQYLIGGEGSTL